jgi:flagella basal body P-ring formation protein FlgA
MEKPNLNKYEIMCFFKEDEKQKKEELIKKLQQLASSELEIKNLETKKMFWPVNLENYLLLHLTTSPEKILQVEKILQKSFFQYLLINLNKEKQIKIKKRLPNSQNISSRDEKLVPNSDAKEESQPIE